MSKTKSDALQEFWSSFGLRAMNEYAVPSKGDADGGEPFPYITYQEESDSFDSRCVLTASVWDKMGNGYNADRKNHEKAEDISKTIGRGGVWLNYDGGCLWITRGSPFAQFMGDPEDSAIRRVVINIVAEFWSAD